MEASTSDPSSSRQITRNRISYSCRACRRRKIRCDKGRPVCTNCSKNGDRCDYDSGPARSADHGQPLASTPDAGGDDRSLKRRRVSQTEEQRSGIPSISQASEEGDDRKSLTSGSPTQRAVPHTIEARLDKLTALIENLSQKSGLDIPLLAPSKAGATAQSTRISPSRPLPSFESVHGSINQGDFGSSSREDPSGRLPSEQAPATDPVNELPIGHLSLQSGGRSRYVGNTYFAYIAEEVAELNQLLRDSNRYYPHPADSGGVSSPPPDPAPELTYLPPSPRIVPPTITIEDSEGTPSPITNDELVRVDKGVLFRTRPLSNYDPVKHSNMHENLLATLPTRERCDVLYRCYLSGVHVIIPMYYPQSLVQWYEEFWEWYDQREITKTPYHTPTYIALLFSILYAGSISCSARVLHFSFDGVSRLSLSTRLHQALAESLAALSFVRSPNLHCLVAFCISQTLLVREEEPLTGSLFLGLAVQMSQTMGIHREPSKYGIDPIEAEVRRRVWWHITWLDMLVSICTGWPPLVPCETYWDVELPMELKDSLAGTEEGMAYLQAVRNEGQASDDPDLPRQIDQSSHVQVNNIVCQGKFIFTTYLRGILKIQLGVKRISRPELQEIKKLLNSVEQELRLRIDRIPQIEDIALWDGSTYDNVMLDADTTEPWTTRMPLFDVMPKELSPEAKWYHGNVWLAYHSWARIMLQTLIDKAYCVAYQPYLKDSKSRLWIGMRKSAIGFCHSYMRGYLALATNPSFQPYQWSWPGGHQPLHAVMILLVDLHERPFSPEAAQSRAYIDRTFSLTGPDGGILSEEDGVPIHRPLREGGKEAWDLLRRLRKKAWEKAGFDPDVLWTNERDTTTTDRSQEDSESSSAAPEQSTNRDEPSDEESSADESSPDLTSVPNVPSSAQGFPTFAAPSTFETAPTPYDAVTLPSTSSVTVVADDSAPHSLGDLDSAQDFDWEAWDRIFGQFSNVEESHMDVDPEVETAWWQEPGYQQ